MNWLRLLGFFTRSRADDPPQPPSPAPPPEPAPPTAVCLWEELIDHQSRIAGYRCTVEHVEGGPPPDAGTRFRLLAEEAAARVWKKRLALFPITASDWLQHDYRRLIAPGIVFLLEPPAPGVSHDAWHEAAPADDALRALADWLILDFRAHALEDLQRTVTAIRSRHPDLGLIADHVPGWPAHRFCVSLGIRHSLGHFASESDAEDGDERLGKRRAVLLELIRLLREEADPAQLAEVCKQDPAIVLRMLTMANSPSFNQGTTVTRFEQAILVLGRSELLRWLTIATFELGDTPSDLTLLELAMRRARFMELLGGPRLPEARGDELFLTGLLSLMDVLLARPIAEIIAPMRPSPAIADALTSGTGPCAPYLRLAVALEKMQMDTVRRLAGPLGIELRELSLAAIQARRWTLEALTE